MKPRLTLIILLSSSPLTSEACSFARAFQTFSSSSLERVTPSEPDFSVTEIRRGSPGSAGMCDDAGWITLENKAEYSGTTGFLFKLVRSNFKDNLFPEHPVIAFPDATNPSEYWFVWWDGLSYEQEPIDIEVEIIGISSSGDTSEPQHLRISHPGVKKKWWQFWK